jgi:hypothetical protein
MPLVSSIAVIVVSVVVFGYLGVLAVAFVEQLGDRRESLGQLLKPVSGDRRSRWKPLLAGVCTAILAGGSAAEFIFPDFGDEAEGHPVLTGTLTGALLAVVTVLVIEALVRSVASRAWHGSLAETWCQAVKGARRGARDLRKLLGGEHEHVTATTLPRPLEARAELAADKAKQIWADLGDRVGRATMVAFASDEPELGETMHRLSTATDTLHRALERYAADQPSDSKKIKYEPGAIVAFWRDYLYYLREADTAGRSNLDDYKSPFSDEHARWLRDETKDHTPTTEQEMLAFLTPSAEGGALAPGGYAPRRASRS